MTTTAPAPCAPADLAYVWESPCGAAGVCLTLAEAEDAARAAIAASGMPFAAICPWDDEAAAPAGPEIVIRPYGA